MLSDKEAALAWLALCSIQCMNSAGSNAQSVSMLSTLNPVKEAASNNRLTVCLAAMLHEVTSYSIDLHRQLPYWRDHNDACAIPGHELGSVKQFQAGN